MTIALSYSKLQAYERCPWLYHLVANEGWRSGPRAGQALGQSLHQTLAAFLSPAQKERGKEKLHEVWDENWVNEGFKNVEETLEAYRKGKAWVDLFFEKYADRFSGVIGTEIDFHMTIDGIRFQGTVDRVDKNADDGYTLVEYKTNRVGWESNRIANDLQMTLYDYGVREALGWEPLRLEFYFFATGETVPTRRTPDQTQEAIARLKKAAESVTAGRFEPNQSYCPRCEFNRRCLHSAVRETAFK